MSRSVMTASVSLPAPLCGRCKEQCDYKSGICAGGCLTGWKGRGCSLKCSPREDCRNPCRCARPCLCDTQFQTCTASLCMAVKESDGITAQDLSLTGTILLVCGCVAAIGVTSVCCLLWRRNSDIPLRGFLANPLCAKCPAFRDCIQKVCAAFGLPCATLRARDSLDSFCDEDEQQVASYSQDIRQCRRGNPTVVGVKTEHVIKRTGTSGYKWKRKWRDRRERSKRKRKEKFAERKLMRAASKASCNDPGTGAGPEGAGPSLPNAPENAFYSKRGSLILPPLSIGFGSGSGGFRRGSLNPMAMIQQLRRGSVRPGEAAAPAPAASTSPRKANAKRSEPADAARAASPTASGSASSGQAASPAGPSNTNQESAALSGQAATGDREPSVVDLSPHEAHRSVKQTSKEEAKEETESGTNSGNEGSGNLKAEDDSTTGTAGTGNFALSDRQEEVVTTASVGMSDLKEVLVTKPK